MTIYARVTSPFITVRNLGLGLALSCGLVTTALAEEFRLDQYTPAEQARDGFALRRPTSLGHLKLGGQLQLAYSMNPLVVEETQGDADTERFKVVSNQLTAHAVVSLGLWDRLVLFGHLPVVIVMEGDEPYEGLQADGAGLSDVGFGARFRILGGNESIFGLAGQVRVSLPTAELLNEDQTLSGDSTASVTPEVIAELSPGPLNITANLGVRVASGADVPTVTSGSEMTFGLGGSIGLYEGKTWEGRGYLEAFGSTVFDAFFAREETTLEALAGFKALFPSGLVAGLAAGPGLGRGVGTPDVRVIGMFGYQPFADKPQPVVDPTDKCPDEKEDVDGFEDEDGCPDLDNDKDKILDTADACPMEPEDYDGFDDEDGCPEPDNDQDGFLDASDACPFQIGDNEGCPAIKPEVIVEEDRITFPRIYFDTDRARIRPESLGILSEVARTLNKNNHLVKLRVEGHADRRGPRDYNIDLSQRRAESVMRFLVSRGVDASRMEAKGYGPDRPNFKNAKTLKQYAINRRVEILIVETAEQNETVEQEAR